MTMYLSFQAIIFLPIKIPGVFVIVLHGHMLWTKPVDCHDCTE